jgi:hypothetical protein
MDAKGSTCHRRALHTPRQQRPVHRWPRRAAGGGDQVDEQYRYSNPALYSNDDTVRAVHLPPPPHTHPPDWQHLDACCPAALRPRSSPRRPTGTGATGWRRALNGTAATRACGRCCWSTCRPSSRCCSWASAPRASRCRPARCVAPCRQPLRAALHWSAPTRCPGRAQAPAPCRPAGGHGAAGRVRAHPQR